MGCDIHLAVEVRRDGKWERALPPEHARDPWLVEQAAKGEGWYTKRAEVEWYDGRNYRLFGVLANVRNGWGFAGIETGDAVRPIAEPRGLPNDLSDAVAQLDYDHPKFEDEGDDISLGDHSQSWLTLAELQAYPWDDGALSYGVVPLTKFADRIAKHGYDLPLRVDDAPYEQWSGAITGQGIETYEADDVAAELRVGGFAVPEGVRPYVRDRWIVPVRSQVSEWCERVMPALAELGAADDVRIVFGFDS